MASVAVIELFTSQGCSSCPPADELLASLARRRASGDPIHTLSFHVDYWDRLGWVDPFSSPRWTRRQQHYASEHGLSSLYTPQALVNCSVDVVGSRKRHLSRAVDEALRIPMLELSATATFRHGSVTVDVEGALDMRLTVAVVQRTARTEVGRGENADRTLQHVDVVRDLAEGPAGRPLILTAPAGLTASELAVVVLMHEAATGVLRGATTVAVVAG